MKNYVRGFNPSQILECINSPSPDYQSGVPLYETLRVARSPAGVRYRRDQLNCNPTT
ncbi:hypothetical protein [Nostoc sp. FACHB-133]|uniref:hypothetical protein n=1 Tax=Nostoc sp. FACHB-133 TaxID=2692835 RepID=UPI0016848F25|nr:hypothetical protein [Nostoc sp. FACHB-133]MBD2523766.1 hypothetical protein [Nostoc sp. FACHB-133]